MQEENDEVMHHSRTRVRPRLSRKYFLVCRVCGRLRVQYATILRGPICVPLVCVFSSFLSRCSSIFRRFSRERGRTSSPRVVPLCDDASFLLSFPPVLSPGPSLQLAILVPRRAVSPRLDVKRAKR